MSEQKSNIGEVNTAALDIERIREDFPILDQQVNGKDLIYFDNAATTQKPLQVIEALTYYYTGYNANIHRGIHTLAERATAAFEETREAVRRHINAAETAEVIITKGTTESINLVAATYGRANVKQGNEILVSGIEHHSNMVPWQMLASEKGAKVRIIPVNDKGELILDNFDELLTDRTRIVAVNHVSNTLGTINPVKKIIQAAHKRNIPVLLDGAQGAAHLDINVQDLDVDFYCFSAHKMYGPTGVGILYGKRQLLEEMPPYQGGGEMIREVSYEACSYNELPYKFEAGTPNIADVIAFKAAIDYIEEIGKPALRAHENQLLAYGTKLVEQVDGLKIVGQANEKVSVISFVIDGVHHQDLGILLDKEGIAIRTGHHCTQPLMGRFNISGTARASFALYNTTEEIDRFIAGINKAVKMLR